MIIDNKGKLFGAINIIDLFLIIAVLGAVVFVGTKLMSGSVLPSNQKFIVKYYTEEVSDFAAEKIKIGDDVMDEPKNLNLGKVTDVKVSPSIIYSPDSSGKIVESPKEGYVSIEITSEVYAQSYPHGFIVEGNQYSINHGLTIRAGYGKIYLRVSGIEAVN